MEKYFYRCEAAAGWAKYFSSEFEISKRKGNAGDMRTCPEYADSYRKSGNDRAFFFYKSFDQGLIQIEDRLSSIGDACYSEYGLYELSLFARYKKKYTRAHWARSISRSLRC